MNTTKLRHDGVLLVAHRGASCLETENTIAAFIAAGNRTYYGIETDVHVTKDGKFILFHDDTTGRVADIDTAVEETEFDTLRSLPLKDLGGDDTGRIDLRMPTLSEYIGICKKYDKKAVLELKNRIEKNKISEIVSCIKAMDYFENVIFISFYMDNLIDLKAIDSSAAAQFLTANDVDDRQISELVRYRLDLDALHTLLTRELVEKLHKNGILVNCWTCDDKNDAQALIDMGVDMITSNCLE